MIKKKAKKKSKYSKKAQAYISGKIKMMMGEGMKHDEAVAKAMGMAKRKGMMMPEKEMTMKKGRKKGK